MRAAPSAAHQRGRGGGANRPSNHRAAAVRGERTGNLNEAVRRTSLEHAQRASPLHFPTPWVWIGPSQAACWGKPALACQWGGPCRRTRGYTNASSMAVERTFPCHQPRCVSGAGGRESSPLRAQGFELVALKQLVPTLSWLESHYRVASERRSSAGLVGVSSPVVPLWWRDGLGQRDGVIAVRRKLIGRHLALEAEPGSDPPRSGGTSVAT